MAQLISKSVSHSQTPAIAVGRQL